MSTAPPTMRGKAMPRMVGHGARFIVSLPLNDRI
jgi:hypothetical protein